MRISDCSSDVCSSDLSCREHDQAHSRLGRTTDLSLPAIHLAGAAADHGAPRLAGRAAQAGCRLAEDGAEAAYVHADLPDRKSVVQGKSVSVSVDLGGRRYPKTQSQ